MSNKCGKSKYWLVGYKILIASDQYDPAVAAPISNPKSLYDGVIVVTLTDSTRLVVSGQMT